MFVIDVGTGSRDPVPHYLAKMAIQVFQFQEEDVQRGSAPGLDAAVSKQDEAIEREEERDGPGYEIPGVGL